MKNFKSTFSISSHMLHLGALGALGTLSAQSAVVVTKGPDGSHANIYFDPVNEVSSFGDEAPAFTGYYLNAFDGSAEKYDIENTGGLLYQAAGDENDTFHTRRFTSGQTIDNNSTYTTGSRLYNNSIPATTWSDTAPNDTGYLGLQIEIDGENHYVWAEITLNDELTFELARFAYNDVAGESITAGQVPEPSSAALLILGAAGALTRRQRKAA
jgi:hypothetical protein